MKPATAEPAELVGHPETQTLEFKAAAALKTPSSIARAVVAMLNTNGGVVWVGIPVVDGRAGFPEVIPNVEQARESLRNHLLDTIEPSPTNEEVRCDQRGGIICVSIANAAARRPYAVLKNQGRQFLYRVDGMVMDMPRNELAAAFGNHKTAPPDEIEQAKRHLAAALLAEQRSGRQRFWWQLIPVPALNIDARHEPTKAFLQKLLTDPSESGNRRNGWSVVFFHDRLPKPRSNGSIVHTFGQAKNEHVIAIDPSGTMTFAVPRVRLDRNWDESSTEIFPFALVEFPVSAFRLACRILQRFGQTTVASGRVVCSAAIYDIAGMVLRPGSPNEPLPPWKSPGRPLDNRVVVDGLTIQSNEIVSNPDAAAYRLVWALYEQFQLEEEDIPSEFDRREKVLRLP